jgi:hypothetical protein
MKMYSLSLSLLVASVGCAGNGTNAGPDAGSADVATIDAPPPPAFVGRWRDLDPSIPENERQVATFAADGTITFVRKGSTGTASWWLEPTGEITVMAGAQRTTGKYYVTADRFVLGTLEPVGAVTGIVGTWTGTFRYGDGTSVETTMELRADNSHAYTRLHDDGMKTVWEGTYTYENTYVMLSFTSPDAPPYQVYVRAIEDIVLGDTLFERLPD